jgi:hypothetical protein
MEEKKWMFIELEMDGGQEGVQKVKYYITFG